MHDPATLLAKRPRRGRAPLTLGQHLRDTEDAARVVFRLDGRWGAAFCRFFGLEGEDRERFLCNLQIAALFHDIGKANDEFQAAVTGSDASQSLRHEHLSALVLHLPDIRDWLAMSSDVDVDVITAAVLSHHLKASEADPWTWGQSRRASRVALRLHEPQVDAILERVREVARLPPCTVSWPRQWRKTDPWETALQAGRQRAKQIRRALRQSDPDSRRRRALLLAVKSGLIVADSVASGLVREGHAIESWIDEVVHAPPLEAEDVEQHIIRARLDQVSRARGTQAELQPFQTLVASRGPRVLMLAACGAGKTLAAWAWAAEQLRARPTGRVIFLYPTRGTATEGFRDYVGWAPEAEGALVHGTSRYELDAMAANPSESIEGKTLVDEGSERLFALGLWSKRYFSATVDQFLGFMEHRYESLCLLPALADSVVIFDEVHSYDESMFRNLVMFLDAFDVPALCMTATLPRSRRAELEARGCVVFPATDDRGALRDLAEKEEHPRYRVKWGGDVDQVLDRVRGAVEDGQRVLWVVNVVARCQALVEQLRDRLGVDVLCYHSRFRLEDRRLAHEATVAAFQQHERAVVAVTTQVCEMSLDLDADLLVTELAPTPSLVQRFGRANRHLVRGPQFRADVVVTPSPGVLPYTRDDLDRARRFVDAVSGSVVSQAGLAERMLEYAADEARVSESARFLNSGYYATPGSLRDESDHLATCVLDTDLPAVEAELRRRRPIDGYVLHAPRRSVLPLDTRPAVLPRHLGIVAGREYDERLGFLGGGSLR